MDLKEVKYDCRIYSVTELQKRLRNNVVRERLPQQKSQKFDDDSTLWKCPTCPFEGKNRHSLSAHYTKSSCRLSTTATVCDDHPNRDSGGFMVHKKLPPVDLDRSSQFQPLDDVSLSNTNLFTQERFEHSVFEGNYDIGWADVRDEVYDSNYIDRGEGEKYVDDDDDINTNASNDYHEQKGVDEVYDCEVDGYDSEVFSDNADGIRMEEEGLDNFLISEEIEISNIVHADNATLNDCVETKRIQKFIQQYVSTYYASKPPIKFYQNRSDCNSRILWENMIEVYNIGVNSSGSGGHDIDFLLKAFKRMIQRQDPTFNLALPKCWKTIYDSCNRMCDDLFTLVKFVYVLPKQFFGEDNTLKTMTCTHLSIGEVIAAQVLDVTDINNFRTDPDIQIETNDNSGLAGERYYEDYSSGDHFQQFDAAIKRKYGAHSVALGIGFSHDEATLNSTRNRSKDPLIVSIANIINEDHKHSLVGFIPSGHSGYSDDELRSLLVKRGHKVEDFQNRILRYINRDIKLQFISSVFKPLLQLGQSGVSLQVTAGEGAYIARCYPHIVLAHGDSLAMDYLCGTNHGKSFHKCRICITEHCNNISLHTNNFSCRDTEAMMGYAVNAEKAMVNKALRNRDKNLRRTEEESMEEEQWEITARFMNMMPGINPLVSLVKWQEDEGCNDFFGMFPPDFLHTFQKGFIEYSISWTLVSVLCVQRLAKTAKNKQAVSVQKYSSCTTLLDERIKNFPMKQALDLTKSVFLRKGIMTFMKSSSTKASSVNKGTSLISGGLEAWKLGPIALQLIFCLSDDILPCTQNWLDTALDCRVKTRSSAGWNILKTCINALVSTMEVVFFWKKTRMSYSEIIHLEKLIQQSRAHLMLLWFMRMDLIQSLDKTNKTRGPVQTISKLYNSTALRSLKDYEGDVEDEEVKEKTSNFAGIKLHLALHFGYMKRKYGADPYLLDTERTEKMHKFFVKESFNATNKQKECETGDMIRMIIRKEHAVKLMRCYILEETENLGEEVSDTNCSPWEALYMLNSTTFGIRGVSRKGGKDFESRTSNYLHRMWTLSSLYAILTKYVTEGLFHDIFKKKWINPVIRSQYPLHLLRQAKIKQINGIDFTIVCDNKGPSNMKRHGDTQDTTNAVSNFSVVNVDLNRISNLVQCVDSEGNLPIMQLQAAKVMCIFEFENLAPVANPKRSVHVLVAWLDEMEPSYSNGVHNYLPYDKFKPSLDSGRGVRINVIPIRSIVEPLFAIPWYNIIPNVPRDRNSSEWSIECTHDEFVNNSFFYYIISPNKANTLSCVSMVDNDSNSVDVEFRELCTLNELPIELNDDQIEYLSTMYQSNVAEEFVVDNEDFDAIFNEYEENSEVLNV